MTVKRPYPACLFPEITPYSTGFLTVDGGHQLYWEQSGNPQGRPVVFLHGGPGAGATPTHRRFFNPDHYRIIIFDQRGAGRSTPLGGLENNSAAHLVQDIESLRQRFGIEQWHIFGGSWGSTLALLYATEHPQRCLSLTLRGIFLLSPEEIHWFMHGIRNIFPEAWEQLAGFIPEEERHDLVRAYYKRLTSPDENVQIEAALNWTLYESACASLKPNYETVTTMEEKLHARALARIEAHYFLNDAIPEAQSLLKRVHVLRSIPATIIHGRYDVICPIITAHRLHQAWPEADYIIVPDAGHSSMDPPLCARLIETMELYKSI
ncbi:MAG: prolyl aminopeptidase [Alphaproteobacteria bacterium]|nr:prolyl aminopeptidase [Alphaproteobacteria bacterium]